MQEEGPRSLGELTSVFGRIQIRAVMQHFPSGPVYGYEWRHQVQRVGQPKEWTEWIYGSRESVRAMLRQWDEFVKRNEGPTTH